ncbi:adenine deaminase [Thalictrum thalictroides]|uniref:Adenine deaminase n=1 Tax=Thalictrum thalictroides TaxID=46969 RepID=A0A7J6WIM0_THATH|nr:adenine deaminase [Thalictrum thalictroides]
MAVTSCEEVQGQDAYNISVESDKENVNPQYLACLNFQEDPQPNENRVCADPQWDSKNCTIFQMGSVDRYSPCDVKIDVKKDLSETPSTCDRTIASLTRTESSLSRMPRGKISLQIGEKIMQLLMENSNMLVNCTSGDKLAERAPDTPNSRWRRYKRAASFDSRKVVLLFSILSSFGTLVLIYLTLRVRQIDDGLAHV